MLLRIPAIRGVMLLRRHKRGVGLRSCSVVSCRPHPPGCGTEVWVVAVARAGKTWDRSDPAVLRRRARVCHGPAFDVP